MNFQVKYACYQRPFDGISHSSAQFLVEIGEENLGR